jgi:hypothetical protein
MITMFWPENLSGRGNLENLGVDGRIILNQVIRLEKIGWEKVDWTQTSGEICEHGKIYCFHKRRIG